MFIYIFQSIDPSLIIQCGTLRKCEINNQKKELEFKLLKVHCTV